MSDRAQKITSIFHSAIERAPHERVHYLDGACAGDDALRREIEGLILSHESSSSFIASPAYERGAELLTTDAGALAGHSFAQYRLVSLLGSGGMGEVYLAEDTRLDRKVALKVLPSHLTADQTQVGRFQQEARAASALNHPNIVTIYEINEAAGTHYIATELIEGTTLRARMASGGLTLAEALDVVVQIASALNAAHSASVVHRDIKPENVMLRPDGYVKVLDFGIAKLMERQRPAPDTEAATRALVQTGKGVVMGTAHYMSPEQARGAAVDARTDIWSLGVVLYELVAGQLPFLGETVSDSIASILKTEPLPLTTIVPAAPKQLEWIVQKALRKDRDERYQTAKELLSDLRAVKKEVDANAHSEHPLPQNAEVRTVETEGSNQSSSSSATDSTIEAATTVPTALTTSSAQYVVTGIRQHKLGVLLALAVLITVVAGVGFALYKYAGVKKSPPPIFQNVQLSPITTSGRAQSADISPDGKYVVYLEMADDGNRSIMVRQTATGNSLPIVPPTKGNVLKKTSFSPDGLNVYYLFSDRTKRTALYQVPSFGGASKKLIDECDSPVAFSPDGKTIAFVRWQDRTSKLMAANPDGTGERVVATKGGTEWFSSEGMSWSPDAKTIACAAATRASGEDQFRLLGIDAKTGAVRELSPKRWVLAGRVVWMPDGSALALIAMERWEEGRTQVWRVSYPKGEASRITNDLQGRDSESLGVTADGRTLVTVTEQKRSRIETIPADGDISRVVRLTAGEANKDGFDGIARTRDGRIVFSSFEGAQPDLWVMNSDGTGRKRLTSDAYDDADPAVSPDGRYIVFESNRPGGTIPHIWRMDIDGGKPVQLTTQFDYQPQVSPDGRWVVYVSLSVTEEEVLNKVSIDGGAPVRLADYAASQPLYSPDGSWLACYAFDDQGTPKGRHYSVIPVTGGRPVKQFDFPGFQYQHFSWTPDSRNLSFIGTPPDPSNIWLQPIAGGEPHPITNFKSDYIFHHAWAPDGRSLALVRGRETADVVLMKDTKY
jgi:serine/threonine protein kinase/WD40 repeat protein